MTAATVTWARDTTGTDMQLKQKPIKSKKLRDAARGQACTLQIVGVCCGDWATTVAAHLPDETHGIARKSDDLSTCFACDSCHSCHSIIDGRAKWPEFELEYKHWYLRRAQTRTLRVLHELEILTIKGAA